MVMINTKYVFLGAHHLKISKQRTVEFRVGSKKRIYLRFDYRPQEKVKVTFDHKITY